MTSGDLIDFDVIEGQKENIQALPGGRSARKLAETFSPSPLHKLSTPTPTDTKNINDCIRAEYEAELETLDECDDPLDIYDRYVRWTFDAYPSAQATAQSQLHTLLERATRAFIGSNQYKNDPRYLKLWLHYIHFFSDAPRETFVFLSRQGIGEGLALYFEEYAEWLESAGRWSQAEEVYKLGIEQEAKPTSRLIRKFGEFESRREAQQPAEGNEPTSPALPTVRPALAAKIDPYAAARAAAADPQAPRANPGVGGSSAKPAKSKLAVFSDASDAQPAMSSSSAGGEVPKGWDTIGSLSERKKENVMEAKPWVGETLQTSVKKSSGPKMAVFRDPSMSSRIAESHIVIAPSKHQVIVNPQNGRRERVFVNLEAVYPAPEEPGTELSFEELWAAHRGWLDMDWESEPSHMDADTLTDDHYPSEMQGLGKAVSQKMVIHRDDGVFDENRAVVSQKLAIHRDDGVFDENRAVVSQKLAIHRDDGMLDENGAVVQKQKPSKAARKKKMEVNETQIIKAKLDSPSGPKMKKKKQQSSEPTMTMHTKAAHDDIYDIFNAPLKPAPGANEESDDDEYRSDDDYTSGAESTGTTRDVSMTVPAYVDDEGTDDKSISEWSDFNTQKHIPNVGGDRQEDDATFTQASDLIDTRTPIHSSPSDEEPEDEADMSEDEAHDLEASPRTRYIPVPPEDYDYDAPNRPYRDPVEVANNRLPFMTPITEVTETSFGLTGGKGRMFNAKTPSREQFLDTPTEEEEDDEAFGPMSSPLQEVPSESRSPPIKIAQPLLPKPRSAAGTTKKQPKGPVIKDLQCNPVDPSVREEILANMQPSLGSYDGFYDHRGERSGKGPEIRRYAKAVSKRHHSSSDRMSISAPVMLEFPELMAEYTLRRELGAGAFAPVYLIENSSPDTAQAQGGDENSVAAMGMGAFAVRQRAVLEALKMEQPPTAWEFHMMRVAASRLGPYSRAIASVSQVHELHLYQDEGYMVLPYHPYGSLLDVVNFFRSSEGGGTGVDEVLAMFFAVELLRTVESLHDNKVLHGDLKADNCLLRLDGLDPNPHSPSDLSSTWTPNGAGGWDRRGIVLIDFGRGIDMRNFAPNAQFLADWKTTAQDCPEMREGRPWTWQIDYYGLAGTIHTLLFGKYIETQRCADSPSSSSSSSSFPGATDGGGILGGGIASLGGRRYRVREPLKRYWQTDIWNECFDVLLNPATHADANGSAAAAGPNTLQPVTHALRRVRGRMEDWLETNCEKGAGLRGLMTRVEGMARQHVKR